MSEASGIARLPEELRDPGMGTEGHVGEDHGAATMRAAKGVAAGLGLPALPPAAVG